MGNHPARLRSRRLAEPLPPCTLTSTPTDPAGILLDFGREIQGHVELFAPIAPTKDPVRVRIRFGESASEAMADLGERNAGNDHAVRDGTANAARIDELVPPGKKDIRGDFGGYCYEGFRRSLCHGWASGPTSWLSRHVLGITPLEPGFARVRIAPRLGSLAWAEGSYPTARGPIHVRHERQPDGSLRSSVDALEGMVVELIGMTLVTRPAAQSADEPLQATSADRTGVTVERPRCEWLVNPRGIVTRRPRLSWIVSSPERDQRQSAYRILVASRPERLEPGRANLWDSGRIESSTARLESGRLCGGRGNLDPGRSGRRHGPPCRPLLRARNPAAGRGRVRRADGDRRLRGAAKCGSPRNFRP